MHSTVHCILCFFITQISLVCNTCRPDELCAFFLLWDKLPLDGGVPKGWFAIPVQIISKFWLDISQKFLCLTVFLFQKYAKIYSIFPKFSRDNKLTSVIRCIDPPPLYKVIILGKLEKGNFASVLFLLNSSNDFCMILGH